MKKKEIEILSDSSLTLEEMADKLDTTKGIVAYKRSKLIEEGKLNRRVDTKDKGFTEQLHEILEDGPKTLPEIRDQWVGQKPASIGSLLHASENVKKTGERRYFVYYLPSDEEEAKRKAERIKPERRRGREIDEIIERKIDEVTNERELSNGEIKYVEKRTREIVDRFTKNVENVWLSSVRETINGAVDLALREMGEMVEPGDGFKQAVKYAGTYSTNYIKFVPGMVEKLGEGEEVISRAVSIASRIPGPYGGSPTGVAGAITFLAMQEEGKSCTFKEIASSTPVSSPTISNWVSKLKGYV